MAVERDGQRDQTAGSNEVARHARSVNALTLRPMNTALRGGFRRPGIPAPGANANDTNARRQMRQHWFVRYAPTLGGVETATSALTMRTGAGSGAAPPAPPPEHHVRRSQLLRSAP